MQGSEEAERLRVDTNEDTTTAEDSRQVLVSSMADLISPHKVAAGARSYRTLDRCQVRLYSKCRVHMVYRRQRSLGR